ncbi:MAG: Bifunctional enzyme CysN/CysC [Alphaproteobacteria bacterium MarineAlpha2_Bin1]|nr:MAG: Bifunctional enzyme CysN/CysC [Alphaproteobacteria bacterium MarineAlpha2_Bin1]
MILNSNFKIVVVGHVDHGKSTVIGRLLADTSSLPDGKLDEIKISSEKRGMPFEWAFILDAFQSERNQGITIDTTKVFFKSKKRKYTIIDCPGHKEFLKNMITGAASADLGVLVIDAVEGIREQSRKHAYLLKLIGISKVIVLINKMDKINDHEKIFNQLEQDIIKYLSSIELNAVNIIPVSAREGEGITTKSLKYKWKNFTSLLETLDKMDLNSDNDSQPLRLPIQDVYKFDDRRILVGRIESGRIKRGDKLIFSPSNKFSEVNSIEAWGENKNTLAVSKGFSVGITLKDQLFIERGEVASHVSKKDMPIETDIFKARVFYLGTSPLTVGQSYLMECGTCSVKVFIQEIISIISTDDLSHSKSPDVKKNQVAELVIRSEKIIAIDEFIKISATGRFILINKKRIVAGGLISMEGYADQRALETSFSKNLTIVEHRVSIDERAKRNQHNGGIFWLTGLSGSGKSTIALDVERRLFESGYQVYLLDGDNVREGLNSNLSFSPEDRSENIRRVGEVALLFANAGFIVLSAFITPYISDRARLKRNLSQKTQFHEIYIESSIAICEERDPKGLYKKARIGEIKDFTGIDSPYDEPINPDLIINTITEDKHSSSSKLEKYIHKNLGFLLKT